jgi:sulfur carrier protein ThiS adenylyltransferase
MNTITPTELFSAHDPSFLPVWRKAVIGIAGAGGLGSNAALSLARAGIGTLIVADFDAVSPSNLNRQQYSLAQIGEPKVKALRDNILACAPFTEVLIHQERITPDNVSLMFNQVDILIEAFDAADQKAMLIEAWTALYPQRPIIAASGLAGVGGNQLIRAQCIGNLYLIGDGISQARDGISPVSARVAVVANMQANLCLELLLHASGIQNTIPAGD